MVVTIIKNDRINIELNTKAIELNLSIDYTLSLNNQLTNF